jgi:hypothetical protein
MTAEYVPPYAIERARILAWATAVGAITAEALAERDGLSTATAKERLDEAVGLGLLECHSLLVGYSDLYTVTRAGRTMARKHSDAGGYSYPEGLPTARATIKDARHTIACASAIAALERRYPDHRVIGERELHREEHAQQRRVGSVSVRRYGHTRSHHPDIVLWEPPAAGEPPPRGGGRADAEVQGGADRDLPCVCPLSAHRGGHLLHRHDEVGGKAPRYGRAVERRGDHPGRSPELDRRVDTRL